MRAKYVNPFTDFGFKRIFGEEASKPQLIDFLNSLLPKHHQIADLQFRNSEQLGRNELERKAMYDIYCQSTEGERFIVELQRAKQNFFRDRTVYYSTFPIREQAEKGHWDFQLKAVYCVGILDFAFNEQDGYRNEYVHKIQLKDQHGRVFYDKLTYIYLEIPHFLKKENELGDRLDKWLYFIKHLEDFDSIPSIFREDVFEDAFEKAEISNLRPAEMDSYEASLKTFRDNINTMNYALEQATAAGLEKGREEGFKERSLTIARMMLQAGEPVDKIVQFTGLTVEEINSL